MRFVITLLCLLLLGAKHPSTCRITVPLGGGVSNGGTAAKFGEDANYDYVITAAHVVTENGQLYPNVRLSYAGRTVSGRVQAHDRASDAAIIRTARTGIPYQPLAPLTGEGTYWSEGMVSGVRAIRYTTSKYYGREGVQFSAFTNQPRQGDSGAPVRDKDGRIVAVLWGGGRGESMTTSVQVIYRRVPTPLRNILRLATFHRPVGVYRPAVVSAAPGATVFAPSQIRCAPGGCPPNTLAYNVPGVRPIIEQPREPTPPYVEPKPVEPPAAIQGPKGDTGPIGPRGPQGEPGQAAEVDYDRIVDAVVKALPQPDVDALADAVIKRLPPIKVQTQNQRGEIMDENEYAYPGPIKIQYYQIDREELARDVAERLK